MRIITCRWDTPSNFAYNLIRVDNLFIDLGRLPAQTVVATQFRHSWDYPQLSVGHTWNSCIAICRSMRSLVAWSCFSRLKEHQSNLFPKRSSFESEPT